jgi:hypothetical protein
VAVVIAQAVSRRLPTTAARVPAQVRSCGICGGQSGTRAALLRVLRFPLPIIITSTAPHSSSIIRGWYNTPISCRRTKRMQSHPTPKKLNKIWESKRTGSFDRLWHYQLMNMGSKLWNWYTPSTYHSSEGTLSAVSDANSYVIFRRS